MTEDRLRDFGWHLKDATAKKWAAERAERDLRTQTVDEVCEYIIDRLGWESLRRTWKDRRRYDSIVKELISFAESIVAGWEAFAHRQPPEKSE